MLLQHLKKLLSKPIADPGITALYRACVVQSRQKAFYETFSVPDTIDGRFDLLVLHVFLVMRRLDADARQQLFDLMFADMDRNLREMGVGDMGIGKRMKRMIAAFYGRTQAYETALGENDDALIVTLKRNIYNEANVPSEHINRLLRYVRQTLIKLENQPVADLLSGQVEFLEPTHS